MVRSFIFDIVIGALGRVELIETIREESISLNKADTIVAGGRGIRNVKWLELLKELAKVLKRYFNKVEIGVSRPLVDAYLVSSSCQIGNRLCPLSFFPCSDFVCHHLDTFTVLLDKEKKDLLNHGLLATPWMVTDRGERWKLMISL